MTSYIEAGALGLVSTRSFPAMVGTADMMLKSAHVTLVGFEKIGSGYCTAVVRGRFADVRLAVEIGAETAEQFGQFVSKLVLPRPMPNLEVILPISSRLARMQQADSRLSNLAVGLLETRGFPAMVAAGDAMLKSADVLVSGYETTGDGLCTILVRGTVANVTMAIETGMYEAERVGELNAVMVIPRPLEDLEHALPTAEFARDEATPLPMLLPKPIEERELVELPDLTQQAEAEVIMAPLPRPRELDVDQL
ncbi:BMC domain-containing protein [Synechococcales cyanobacterium C]|uniref:BMC domain-containing protein n=1 Tax=Petrachloros mirabilis ULC683 TaxID=2781853 RepID=A0A8K2ACK7_9CYAN|nr:carbon dioxide-concentrating mechanism protein [Petrachloros mirabilis]NCJ05759.1 BMC domain-containing protein [Petrachloros mirabilis ULC683]